MAVYKYCLDEPFHHATGIYIPKPVAFHDQNGTLRMQVDTQGVMTIFPSYAWDGCSPTIKICDWGYMGIPDGALNAIHGKPKTYYGTLVHDALRQFDDHPDMPFTSKQIDLQFYSLLRQSGFSLSEVYYIFVRLFGGMYSWLKLFFS